MIYGELVRLGGVEGSELPDTIRLQTPQFGTKGAATRSAVGVRNVIMIGRHFTNDVPVLLMSRPERISNVHASVALTAEGAHVLTDTDSFDGTYVNDCLLPRPGHALQHGDVVTLGGPRIMEHGAESGKSNLVAYQYRRPLSQDAWKIDMLDAWEERRPAKRAKKVHAAADSVPWIDDDVHCAICTEVFVNPYLVNGCGHTFCYRCIVKWISERSRFCPICRHAVAYTLALSVTPNLVVQTLLERHVFPRLAPEEVEERTRLTREVRSLSTSPVTVGTQPQAPRGSFAEVASRLVSVTGMAMRVTDTPGTTRRHVTLVEPSPPRWKAVSSQMLIDTPCSACHGIIPARFVRLRRTVVRAMGDVHLYVHLKRACVGRLLPEIVAQAGVCDLEELSDQERRVAKGICETGV
jgi:hypothetical protein